jgi:ATP-dependent DNA ligase
MVFDSPKSVEKSFTERLQLLQSIQSHPIVQVTPFIKCENEDHFYQYFHQLQTDPHTRNIEGILLKKPTSWYFAKDSFFQKLVTFTIGNDV